MSKGKAKKSALTAKPKEIRDLADPTAERVPAGTLQSHPHNWRTHPNSQRNTLRDLYRELGFVKPVDVYMPREGDALVLAGKLRAGVLCLADGHLRVEELPPEYRVPINRTTMTETEALKYLATADPLSAIAEQDDSALIELLSKVESDSAAVQKLVSDLIEVDGDSDSGKNDSSEYGNKFQILIDCKDEDEQRELLADFLSRGLTCRSLMG